MVENLYEMNVSGGDGYNISDKIHNSTDTRIPGKQFSWTKIPYLYQRSLGTLISGSRIYMFILVFD